MFLNDLQVIYVTSVKLSVINKTKIKLIIMQFLKVLLHTTFHQTVNNSQKLHMYMLDVRKVITKIAQNL